MAGSEESYLNFRSGFKLPGPCTMLKIQGGVREPFALDDLDYDLMNASTVLQSTIGSSLRFSTIPLVTALEKAV